VAAGCGAVAADPADGEATCEVAGLAPGPHSVLATYSGSARDIGSRSAVLTQTVASPSSVPSAGGRPAPEPAPAGAAPVILAPRIDLTYTPNNDHRPNPAGGPRWTFRFSDPTREATFLCRLDQARFRPCSSPQVYRHLRRGRHVFRVKAIAADGTVAPVRIVRFLAGGTQRREG
jgi:hypothetical protein